MESTRAQTEIVLVDGTRVRTTANMNAALFAWREGNLMALEALDGHGCARPVVISPGAVIMVVALR
jgi:hypothetical protein